MAGRTCKFDPSCMVTLTQNPSGTLWQAVENRSADPKTSSNWGLIKADFAKLERPEYELTKKYWAFANYTRFIRPGYRFLKTDYPDAVVAENPETNEVVIVAVNPGIVARMLDIRLPDAKRGTLACKTFTTEAHDNLAASEPAPCGGTLDVHAGPMSVVTVVATPQVRPAASPPRRTRSE